MNKNIVVIVPYRNREKHLFNLMECLKYRFNTHPELTCHVFVAEQNNNELFNCGLMKNSGFMYAIRYMKQKYGTDIQQVIFNDVDCWIETEEALQHYIRDCKDREINHVYGRSFCLGGIFSIQASDFIEADGFPNSYQAWGGEDNVLESRVNAIGVHRRTSVIYERHKGKPHVTEDAEHDRDMSNRDINENKWKKNQDTSGLKDIPLYLESTEATHKPLSFNVWFHHLKI